VFEPTGLRRDAASVIFNLPGYQVIDAVELPLGGRRIKIQPVDLADGCPDCGVVSSRVHAWSAQRVRDVPHAGRVQVVVGKPRLVCAESACDRRTFTPATDAAAGPGPLHDPVEDGGAERGDRLGPCGGRGRRRLRRGMVDGAGHGQRRRGAAAQRGRPARPAARRRRAPLPLGPLVPR
jgi:transposase IS204/IS1001/IS1096/IS1165 family protein